MHARNRRSRPPFRTHRGASLRSAQVDLPKNRIALAAGVAVAGILTAALVVWPALIRPEPPLEKAGDGGLRIRIVEPPRAAVTASSPLDLGVSDIAQAMAKGREALFARTPSVRSPSPVSRPPAEPARTAQAEAAEDTGEMLEPADDRWERQDRRRRRFEQAQLRRMEDEALAREARDERLAMEREASDRRTWEDARERDRYEDRYRLPPEEDREPAPERW